MQHISNLTTTLLVETRKPIVIETVNAKYHCHPKHSTCI